MSFKRQKNQRKKGKAALKRKMAKEMKADIQLLLGALKKNQKNLAEKSKAPAVPTVQIGRLRPSKKKEIAEVPAATPPPAKKKGHSSTCKQTPTNNNGWSLLSPQDKQLRATALLMLHFSKDKNYKYCHVSKEIGIPQVIASRIINGDCQLDAIGSGPGIFIDI